MTDEAPKKRTRRPRQQAAPVQFPVEATIWMPGQKEPRRLQALWVRRDPGGITLGIPELERPYMSRTVRVPDASGAVVELVELAYQQPAAPPQAPPSWPVPREPASPAGGVGAVLRQDGAMLPPRLRSAITPAGPVSEVRDESGVPTVVSAAFGMPLPT